MDTGLGLPAPGPGGMALLPSAAVAVTIGMAAVTAPATMGCGWPG